MRTQLVTPACKARSWLAGASLIGMDAGIAKIQRDPHFPLAWFRFGGVWALRVTRCPFFAFSGAAPRGRTDMSWVLYGMTREQDAR